MSHEIEIAGSGSDGPDVYCYSAYNSSLRATMWYCKPTGCEEVNGRGYGIQSKCAD